MSAPRLLQRAADLREDVARVGADETNGSDDDHEDHRQHDGVFGDVLALFIGPEPVQPMIAKFAAHNPNLSLVSE